jgi:DNA-binding NtrC family response regulator
VVWTYYCGYGVDLPSVPSLGGLDADSTCGDTDSIDPKGPLSLEEQINRVERRIIEAALRRHNYRRSDTARELGISRVTLYNKMKKFGMLS